MSQLKARFLNKDANERSGLSSGLSGAAAQRSNGPARPSEQFNNPRSGRNLITCAGPPVKLLCTRDWKKAFLLITLLIKSNLPGARKFWYSKPSAYSFFPHRDLKSASVSSVSFIENSKVRMYQLCRSSRAQKCECISFFPHRDLKIAVLALVLVFVLV